MRRMDYRRIWSWPGRLDIMRPEPFMRLFDISAPIAEVLPLAVGTAYLLVPPNRRSSPSGRVSLSRDGAPCSLLLSGL